MWVVQLEMAPLTPAQKAVLERIEKKKELQQRAAKKRKARTEPIQDASLTQDTTVLDDDNVTSTLKKRRKVDVDEPSKNEAEPAAMSSVKAPTRRARKTGKLDETSGPAADEGSQLAETPVKTAVRRGRKTVVVEEAQASPANQTMNEAQLRVLQMLEEKKAAKEKGRKSLKAPTPVVPKKADVVNIDSESSNQELAVSSTVPEPVPRGKRKTTNLETTLSTDPPSEKVVATTRRRPVKVVPVEISDPEEEPPPPSAGPDQLSETRLEEEQEEELQGPLNATMMAVMERIKEKRTKEPVKKRPTRAKAATKKPGPSPSKARAAKDSPGSSPSKTLKSEGPLTPNQVSVLKQLRERKTKDQPSLSVESSDDEEAEECCLTSEEIEAVLDRLSVPLNHRETHFMKRLRNEGVYDAVNAGRTLTKEQLAMVVKFRHVLRAKSSQNLASSSKSSATSREFSKDEFETDESDEQAQPPKTIIALESDEEANMDVTETKSGKTFLIFDTNAYLKILPYCRAVLESEKLKDEPDYQDLTMFALFVVIRELDLLSKRKLHLKQPAMAAIRLIHGALQDKNARIEGQDYASSKEKLSDSKVNDDYILNSANLLKSRGEDVIVVTDDKNLQVKIAMMRIDSLNCLEFIARFHWLTPLITSNIKREMLTVGEDNLARFAEIVVASIVLKGVLAHLAPLPMERRREMFPSEKLPTTLALLLKNKALLQAHSGPFTVLSYDRVAQTLNPLQTFLERDRGHPKDEERFKFFARFLVSAEVLCRSIAGYFPNMESRAELVAAIGSLFQMHLPEDERVAVRRVDSHGRSTEKPSTSRWEPAAKALLPTKRAPPSVMKHILESPRSIAQPAAPAGRRTLVAAAERTRPETQPPVTEPELKPRTPRQTRTARARHEEPEQEVAAEPVYFSFSQGRQAQNRFEQDAVVEASKPYAITPTRPVGRKAANDPYADLHDSINEDVTATVYEYFQKFGLSICNYTGSCCVKLGVRFSLAFKVSSARLEASLPEVTESFDSVLKAMKKIIMGSQTSEPARDFLLHSSQVMDAIGRSDPQLVNNLPKITPDALLSFSRDPEGKQQLVTGYQQFCDFSNCLEKCWLEAQRA